MQFFNKDISYLYNAYLKKMAIIPNILKINPKIIKSRIKYQIYTLLSKYI